MMRGPEQMASDSEEIRYETVHRQEALSVSWRFEPTHLVLALARRLVGDFGAIVRVMVRAVHHGRRCQVERRVTEWPDEPANIISHAPRTPKSPTTPGVRPGTTGVAAGGPHDANEWPLTAIPCMRWSRPTARA